MFVFLCHFLHIRQHYAVNYKSSNQLISIFTKFKILNLIFEYFRIFGCVFITIVYFDTPYCPMQNSLKFGKVLENWKSTPRKKNKAGYSNV